jgi:hypothetical protein
MNAVIGYREPDGAPFPVYDGELLCWSTGVYDTWNERHAGYPRMRAVIRAMKRYRPVELERERREMLRASFDAMFGRNAKRVLAVIESEIG